MCRPIDEEIVNLDGGPAPEDEPFDYDAVPTRFFFDVETVGGLDPDQIVMKGISELQRKLATIISELQGGETMDGMDYGGAQSPQMNGGGYGAQDGGYASAYGGGNASSWGGAAGGTTPYGATPYGQQPPAW